MEGADEVIAIMVVRSAHPLSLASDTAHTITSAAYMGQEGTGR